MLKTFRKINPYSILIFIILFHLVATLIWITIDKSYLKLDAWGHYRYSLETYDFLKGILHLKFPLSAIEPQKWHGILVGFSTAFLYFIFGNAQDTAIMINSTIFLTILVLSTYYIAKRIAGIQAGILAVLMLTSYPIIYNNLRIYMLDLPLASLVMAGLYFLITSENFANRRNSLLFGLTFGLGLLIKFNYIAFIIGPLIFTIYQAVQKNPSLHKNLFRNILYAVLIVIFLCGFFYIVRSKDMFQRIYDTSNLSIFRDYKSTFFAFLPWRFSWILKSVEMLISQGISFIFLIAFIVGFVFFVKMPLQGKWKFYLVLVIPLFMQFFLFSIPPECVVRYSIPFLPVMAIITSIGLLQIKNKLLKIAFLSTLLILGLIQFFAVSYGITILPQKVELALTKKPFNFNLVIFQQTLDVPPFLQDKNSHPSTADWKSAEVLDTILKSNISGDRIKVISLSNIPELFEAMAYQILIKRRLVDLMPASSITMERFYEKRQASIDMLCLDADYIIISDNPDTVWERVFDSNPYWKNEIENAKTIFYQNITHFRFIDTLRLPNNINILIYKNIFKESIVKSQEIQQGNIKLLFDNGHVRIFFKEREITKGLGLYASFFSLLHWRDSMEATWEVKKLNGAKLIAQGRWMFIPLVQTWEIELKEGNTIDWRIKTVALDVIKIEAEDYKLMLSDNYKEWFVSNGEKGEFSNYFEKDLWKKFWVGNINYEVGLRAINIPNTSLPSVKLRAYQIPSAFFACIENSDQLFNGRVIGYSKNNLSPHNLFSPGQYKYFSAEISIE
jgi:4-amino-4-deoxy-L-arabinose transferase-like glycosyltransferase